MSAFLPAASDAPGDCSFVGARHPSEQFQDTDGISLELELELGELGEDFVHKHVAGQGGTVEVRIAW